MFFGVGFKKIKKLFLVNVCFGENFLKCKNKVKLNTTVFKILLLLINLIFSYKNHIKRG